MLIFFRARTRVIPKVLDDGIRIRMRIRIRIRIKELGVSYCIHLSTLVV